MTPELFCQNLNAYLAQFDCTHAIHRMEDVIELVKDAKYSTFFKPEILSKLEEIVTLYESNKTVFTEKQNDAWLYLAKIRSNVHFIPQIDADGYF